MHLISTQTKLASSLQYRTIWISFFLLSRAGLAAGKDVEEPVLVDEDPFAGHATETDVSEAIQ